MQDVVVHTDNVLFRKEKFYSPSQRKIYLADAPRLPGGVWARGPGDGHHLRLRLPDDRAKNPGLVSPGGSPNLRRANLQPAGQHQFHAEKDAVYQAGLSSSPWQHLDDTATRVNGQNHHCHVVNNPLYYLTTPSKDRLSVRRVAQRAASNLPAQWRGPEVFGNCWGVRHNPPATEPLAPESGPG